MQLKEGRGDTHKEQPRDFPFFVTRHFPSWEKSKCKLEGFVRSRALKEQVLFFFALGVP